MQRFQSSGLRGFLGFALPCLLGASLLLGGTAAAKLSFNVAQLSADGQEVRNLTCELESGGLFGTIAVVSTLAKQKQALDACAPEGAAFSVKWNFAKGKVDSIKFLSSTKKDKEACVAAALQLVRTDLGGTCTAIILTGKQAGAHAAAETLAPSQKSDQPERKSPANKPAAGAAPQP